MNDAQEGLLMRRCRAIPPTYYRGGGELQRLGRQAAASVSICARAACSLARRFSRRSSSAGRSTSLPWGASKPAPEFFQRVAESVPFRNDEILYVGDRVDNDLRPAVAAGMHTALVHRARGQLFRGEPGG